MRRTLEEMQRRTRRKDLQPFFSFYGGKWRAAKHYPPPVHDTIIEPFAGSAGYSVRYPDRSIILVERDPKIADTWRYLIGVSEKEILSLPDVRNDQTVGDLNICPEAQLLIGWWLNKGCVYPCKMPGSWMRGNQRPTSFWGFAIRERIARQLQYIRHWKLIEGDYLDAPAILGTWFVDPPYSQAGKHYKYGSKDIDYPLLAKTCLRLRGQIIVCENEGADWLPFSPWRHIQANGSKRGGKISKEAIWLREAP